MTVTTIFRAWIGLLLVDLGLWAHGCDLSACRARSRKEMETWMRQNSGNGGKQC